MESDTPTNEINLLTKPPVETTVEDVKIPPTNVQSDNDETIYTPIPDSIESKSSPPDQLTENPEPDSSHLDQLTENKEPDSSPLDQLTENLEHDSSPPNQLTENKEPDSSPHDQLTENKEPESSLPPAELVKDEIEKKITELTSSSHQNEALPHQVQPEPVFSHLDVEMTPSVNEEKKETVLDSKDGEKKENIDLPENNEIKEEKKLEKLEIKVDMENKDKNENETLHLDDQSPNPCHRDSMIAPINEKDGCCARMLSIFTTSDENEDPCTALYYYFVVTYKFFLTYFFLMSFIIIFCTSITFILHLVLANFRLIHEHKINETFAAFAIFGFTINIAFFISFIITMNVILIYLIWYQGDIFISTINCSDKFKYSDYTKRTHLSDHVASSPDTLPPEQYPNETPKLDLSKHDIHLSDFVDENGKAVPRSSTSTVFFLITFIIPLGIFLTFAISESVLDGWQYFLLSSSVGAIFIVLFASFYDWIYGFHRKIVALRYIFAIKDKADKQKAEKPIPESENKDEHPIENALLKEEKESRLDLSPLLRECDMRPSGLVKASIGLIVVFVFIIVGISYIGRYDLYSLFIPGLCFLIVLIISVLYFDLKLSFFSAKFALFVLLIFHIITSAACFYLNYKMGLLHFFLLLSNHGLLRRKHINVFKLYKKSYVEDLATTIETPTSSNDNIVSPDEKPLPSHGVAFNETNKFKFFYSRVMTVFLVLLLVLTISVIFIGSTAMDGGESDDIDIRYAPTPINNTFSTNKPEFCDSLYSPAQINLLDFSYLSLLAYSSHSYVIDTVPRIFKNDTEVIRFNDNEGECIYLHVLFNSTDTCVVSIRGSSNFIDIVADVDLWGEVFFFQGFNNIIYPLWSMWPVEAIIDLIEGISYFSNSIEYSIQYYNNLQYYIEELLQRQKDQTQCTGGVFISGHSLGGGLAYLMASRFNLESIKFANPGLYLSSGKFDLVPKSLFQGISVKSLEDIVPKIDENVGTVHHIPCPYKEYYLCHKITHYICQMIKMCGDVNGRYIYVPECSFVYE